VMTELIPKGAAERKLSRRRVNDRYLSPPMATSALMQAYPEICGELLIDPCCGDGRMARQLVHRFLSVRLNDIDPAAMADFHEDATDPMALWSRFGSGWAITNPPFNRAAKMVPQALDHGLFIAFLLRITFLEPTEDRQWLARRPPTAILILPRIDFIGAGQTDSAPCAWMIWGPVRPGIKVMRAEDVGQIGLAL
jgi:hypothetical protein